jgi:hypothetical protein
MRVSCLSFPEPFQICLRSLCCLALVAGCVTVTANEPFLSKPSQEWTEAEALEVLNDSPWAHTITTTTQDFQCDYEHPAFSGTFTEEFAQKQDSFTPTPPTVEVKPDGAQYLVRLVSAKPIQAAIERFTAVRLKVEKNHLVRAIEELRLGI